MPVSAPFSRTMLPFSTFTGPRRVNSVSRQPASDLPSNRGVQSPDGACWAASRPAKNAVADKSVIADRLRIIRPIMRRIGSRNKLESPGVERFTVKRAAEWKWKARWPKWFEGQGRGYTRSREERVMRVVRARIQAIFGRYYFPGGLLYSLL